MRIILPVLSLLITIASVGIDLTRPQSRGTLCSWGLCRSDQMFASIDAQGITPASMGMLLDQDSSNPLVWCSYAQALEREGKIPQASAVFDRAILLGPNMPPVLMRAANFSFAHGRRPQAWSLSRRILDRTSAFDQILFSYLNAGDASTLEFLGTAIPATPRAARAWLSWLRVGGSDQAVIQTWGWMKQNGLCDRPSAVEAAWTLWERHSFPAAQQVWIDWLGPKAGDYRHPQQLANWQFQSEPQGGPFDWSLDAPDPVVVSRNNGLEIRFQGTENVVLNHIRQTAVLRPGRYRFSAEVQSDGLTTDQGLFFHIFDPIHAGILEVKTPQVRGTVRRSQITAEISVSPATQAVMVELERQASERFDNKINGTLHIYQVSLLPDTMNHPTIVAAEKAR